MADFSWAYVDCDNTAVTSFTSPTGSVIFSAGHKARTGSQRMMWDTGTGDGDTHVLRITGTLDVSGTIRSYKLETITYENTTYLGSNTFGNSSGDTHKFTGEISGSGPLNIVGAATLESTLYVTGAISGAVGITGSSLQVNDVGYWNANGNVSSSQTIKALQFMANTGGTNRAKITGEGEISGSGPLNIVGAATLESTLNVTGAITTAAGLTASVGISSSYGFLNRLQINGGGTNNIKLKGTGEISGSGPLNIVGAATLEDTLHVTGAITTAAGLTASVGVSSSYGFLNRLQINGGGTRQIKLKGNGILTIEGSAADRTCLSASGDINVVGKGFFENTLNISGAITTAAGVTASAGVSSSYGFLNRLQINGGGTNNIKLKGNGEISGSGPLNIVGAATLESTLNVTGAITTAAGVTASAGVSSSYGFVNNLGINQGGTKSISLNGNGTIVIAGQAADTTCLSASGDINVVGKGFFENTLHVSGAVSGAVGITGSSLTINDTIELNANGNITNVHHIYPAADNTYDLGAEASRWRNIYTGDLHLKNDRGDWTVIEESDYLSLTNNKTGHRYKILMERID
jgi:hypothetical protein